MDKFTMLKTALLIVLMLLTGAPSVYAQQAASVSVSESSGSLNLADEAVTKYTRGNGSVAVQITGTFAGTVSFEATVDGSTWTALNLTPPSSTTAATSATSTGLWVGSASGLQAIRARMSAYTSGTAVVTVRVTPFGGGSGGGGAGGGGTQYADGAATATPTGTVAMGTDGTNVYPLVTSATGILSVTCTNCSGSGASSVDNAAFTFGTTSIAPIGGVFDDTASNAATENSAAIARITSAKALHVNLRTAAGVEASLGTDYTHDAALTVASTAGPMGMGRASAAAPANAAVIDGDAVLPWFTLPGAQVAQPSFGGVLASAGSGINGTGVQRFTLATDDAAALDLASIDSNTTSMDSTLSQILNNMSTDATADAAAKTTGPQLMAYGKATAPLAMSADGDATPIWSDLSGRVQVNLSQIGGVAPSISASGAQLTAQLDPCSSEAKTTVAISLITDTVVIPAVASKKNYICSIVTVAAAAEIISITEGTGVVCATGEAALVGSLTDADGMSFAANSGFSSNGGNATAIAGVTASVDTCINVSGTNRVSGFLTYVQR